MGSDDKFDSNSSQSNGVKCLRIVNNYRDRWNTRIFLVTKICYAVKIQPLPFTCEDNKVVRTTSVSVSRKLRFHCRIFSINHFYWHILKYNSVAFFFTNISCLAVLFQITYNPTYFYEDFMSSCSYIPNTYKAYLLSPC